MVNNIPSIASSRSQQGRGDCLVLQKFGSIYGQSAPTNTGFNGVPTSAFYKQEI